MTTPTPTTPEKAQAITAAAEAMEDAAMQWLGRDLGTLHRDDIARAAIEAALPVLEADLRARIADEIEAMREPIPSEGWQNAVVAAVRVVRGEGNPDG